MIIDILTTTRAEYGLMRPLIQSCSLDEDIHVRLLVTGTHLLEDYGMTYKEIEQDGFPIYKKVNIMGLYSGMEKTSEIMSNALKEFTKHFITDKPDFLLVDGDRYETMAVCLAAFNTNTPIIHLSGGATTEGAADEFYRHAISKMASPFSDNQSIQKKNHSNGGKSEQSVCCWFIRNRKYLKNGFAILKRVGREYWI